MKQQIVAQRVRRASAQKVALKNQTNAADEDLNQREDATTEVSSQYQRSKAAVTADHEILDGEETKEDANEDEMAYMP